MTKTRKYPSAIALGSLTAAVALLAGLGVAQAQAPAPGPPLAGAGSFPGSFIVPGTNTSLHIGGVVELDMSYGPDESDGSTSLGAYDNSYPAAAAVHGAGVAPSTANNSHGVFRMTDQFTRPNIETRTPTPYGELKTYIELDFAGSASITGVGPANVAAAGAPPGVGGTTSTACCGNFSLARIKQAYGTLGPWLFGMANSNYSDLDAWPDTIDGGGDAGGYMFNASRYEPQVRYTYLLPGGISVAASIESFQSSGLIVANSSGATGPGSNTLATPLDGFTTAGVYSTCTAAALINGCSAVAFNDFDAPGYSEHLPAFTAIARIDQPWGHTAFHVVVAREEVQDQFTGGGFGASSGLSQGSHLSKWGYMVQESGHFNTIGRDKITWMVNYGQGAANYNNAVAEVGTQWEEGIVCSLQGNPYAAIAAQTGSLACSEPRTVGFTLGYSHWWTDEWRSGVSMGYDTVSKPNAAGAWLQPPTASSAGLGTVVSGSALSLIERRLYSGHANILWSPIPAAQFGLEFQWYHRVVQSGASGTHERIAAQTIFKF